MEKVRDVICGCAEWQFIVLMLIGSFSKVYRGTLHQTETGTIEVAVKAMKSEL